MPAFLCATIDPVIPPPMHWRRVSRSGASSPSRLTWRRLVDRRLFAALTGWTGAAGRPLVPVSVCAAVWLALLSAAFPATAEEPAGSAPAAVSASTRQPRPCPDNPDALSTSRVIAVDPATMPRLGRKQFPDTLPLEDKEVVLTFDDGPNAGTTPAVLNALKRECVLATFFLIGRNALAHPDLAKRELAEGHTVAYHSFSHPLLNHISPDRAEAEIDRGFAAVDKALYGSSIEGQPRTPFFRFPGFASTPHLLDRLAARNIAVFGADLWASDWNHMTPEQELHLVLGRLDEVHGGIILFHDTKRQTAAMLPAFLRSLKTQGYRIVHVVAAAHEKPAM